MWPRLRRPWTVALAPSRKVAIGAATCVVLTLVTGVQYLPARLQLREGRVSPRDVTASRTVEFVDRARTEALRRAAADSIQPVYRRSAGEITHAQDVIARTVAVVERARRGGGLSYTERRVLLSRESPIPLNDPAALAALTVDAAALALARTTAERVVTASMDAGIKPEELPRAQMQARVVIRALQLSGRTMTLASALVQGALEPNITIDVAETQRLQQRAAESVEPVTTRILRGEIVVRRGEVVTEAHMQKLAALGLVPFVGSSVGVYAIKRIVHRTDLMLAGAWVGGANAICILALNLMDQLPWYPDIATDAIYGSANGVIVGVIAIGTLPYLEQLFGLVTPIKLLELSNPSHPLLRRMQVEAAGTYHHSLIVANLAEAAADAIGEEVFRYEGPKRQSREAAVVMLADALEGATRALPKATPDRIEQTARRIIRDKLDDGQLNESNLSFRDLDVIARTFSRLLA